MSLPALPPSTPGAPTPRPDSRALAIVYLTVFLDLLGFGLILPQLPHYALHFGVSALGVGALMSAFSISQFAGAAILGRISDRVGRRPVILISLFGQGIAYLCSALSQSYLQLLLARALAGLFAGSIAAAQAYVADVTTPEQRGRYMGLVGASIGAGFVLGPFIGAELSRFGFATAALASCGLALTTCVLAYVFLQEPVRLSQEQRKLSLSEVLDNPVLRPLLIAMALNTLGLVFMESTFALLVKLRFDIGPVALGRLFAGIGVTLALVQGGLFGPLSRRLGERFTARLGAATICVALVWMPYTPVFSLLLVSTGLLALGNGLLAPSLSTLLSRSAPVSAQGAVLGLGHSISAASRASGPLLAGTLFDRAHPAPYLVGAALFLIIAVLLSIPTQTLTARSN